MSLKEAYNKFKESNADAKIGLSKFCDLRPQHVKLFDHTPHYVCVCQYHENIRLLLTALRGHTALLVEFRPFIDQITCDSSSKACMYSECSTCKSKIDNYSPKNDTDTITYQQWQNNDKIEKIDINSTVKDAFEKLKSLLKEFLIHTYVKRKQAKYMTELISNVDGKKVLLQIDFSENATIASQHEVQSAHRNHGSATLLQRIAGLQMVRLKVWY